MSTPEPTHAPAPPRLRAPLIAAAVPALCAFWQRWRFLAASPYPLGVDGYFYPVQLRSLLERGSLYYPSAPLDLWLMAPLAWLSDPITGAKLGAALGPALVVWPAHVCGRRGGSGGSAAGAGVAAVSRGSGSWGHCRTGRECTTSAGGRSSPVPGSGRGSSDAIECRDPVHYAGLLLGLQARVDGDGQHVGGGLLGGGEGAGLVA